jgi:hypothetical protein
MYHCVICVVRVQLTNVSRDTNRNQAGSWLDTPGIKVLVSLGDMKERKYVEYLGILSELVWKDMEWMYLVQIMAH